MKRRHLCIRRPVAAILLVSVSAMQDKTTTIQVIDGE